MERWIRLIAGTLILASLALAHWVNPNWLWFTAFVGANLFQSSLTRWCLMEDILNKLGVARKSQPQS
jgi:Inner membrane protein YgaP-like, transmembrane domain